MCMVYIWIPDHLFGVFSKIQNDFITKYTPTTPTPIPTTPIPTLFFSKKLSPQGLLIAYLRLFSKQINPCPHPPSRINRKNGLVYCKHCLEAFIEESLAETFFHREKQRFVVIHNKNMISLDDMYALVLNEALHPTTTKTTKTTMMMMKLGRGGGEGEGGEEEMEGKFYAPTF